MLMMFNLGDALTYHIIASIHLSRDDTVIYANKRRHLILNNEAVLR